MNPLQFDEVSNRLGKIDQLIDELVTDRKEDRIRFQEYKEAQQEVINSSRTVTNLAFGLIVTATVSIFAAVAAFVVNAVMISQ